MGPRIDLMADDVATGAVRHLIAAERPLRDVVPASTLELVRIRASQINGCGFCVDMHTKDAAAAGETAQRLNLVAAWREATTPASTSESPIAAPVAPSEMVTETLPLPGPGKSCARESPRASSSGRMTRNPPTPSPTTRTRLRATAMMARRRRPRSRSPRPAPASPTAARSPTRSGRRRPATTTTTS